MTPQEEIEAILIEITSLLEQGLSALDDNPSELDDCVIIEDALMSGWNRSDYTEWLHR